jgi:diguanylate cyclase (GGDEF)-like protein
VFSRANPLILALLAFAGGMACAQEYSLRSFGVAEGLTNLVVRSIFEDRAGFLWISTENGVYRYDGDHFEPFGPAQGIPENSGATFGNAPDGTLLVGGDFGLYHLSENRFEQLPGPFKTIPWAQSIESDEKGHTFIGTDAGLFELSSQPAHAGFTMRSFPRPAGSSGPGAYGILLDGDVIWYGCGRELCRMDSQGTGVTSQARGLPGQSVLVIMKDSSGNLWVRERNSGVFVWSTGQAGFKSPKLPFPADDVVGMPYVDRTGRVLLTTAGGLLIWDGKVWQKVDRSSGLRGTVYSAFEDRQHSLWIGLAGRGLVQWRGYGEWESYSNESGLTSDIVYEILPRDDGSLWVATEAGLFRGARHHHSIAFKPVAGLSGFPVHSLRKAPNGDIWIGTETKGAARLNPSTGRAEWFSAAQGLAGKAAYTLRFDSHQRLWAATDLGLFMAPAPYRRFSRIMALPPTRMWAVAEGTDGTMWAGGAGGLFEAVGDSWRTITKAQGLSNTEVLSLGAGPGGEVWVGYRFGGGIDRVHPQHGGISIEKGVQRGGANGLVYFLDYDASGRLWAGTEQGVDVWDGRRWSHYNMSDGLAWDDCNLNAFAQEPDGTVWIGTGGGLSRYKPLPQQSVNAVVFRYRLAGASSTWTETSQRELQFANLAPGEYNLQVGARDEDSPWSNNSAGYSFRVLPPWYATWWFVALCLFVPLSVAGGMLRIRFLSAKLREKELMLLVQEKTADLRRANEELSLLSFTDMLTGIANRRVFDSVLERECTRLSRGDSSLSLLSIDADHFKAVNDSQGHMKGDEYLRALGAELKRLCKKRVDLPARYGGEEFAVILPDTDAAGARLFAESIREAVAALRLPHPASPVTSFLTVSVGVATASKNCYSTPATLMAAADSALYAAKKAGRNRVCAAPGPDSEGRSADSSEGNVA